MPAEHKVVFGPTSAKDSGTHDGLRLTQKVLWIHLMHWHNVGSRLVKGSSIMLKFSKFIQTPMLEKWVLNNANFFEGTLNV